MPELREAHAHCLRASRRHYENFPVVALLGGDERRSVAAIYAFARTADDFADEPEHAGRREALIDAWEAALRAAVEGRPEGPVMTALAHAIQRHDLPIDPFLDLLDAFRQDVRQDRHDTWESLLEYSRRSANPIGRLVLRVHGVSGEVPARHADALCTALQLANFWQDVGVDASRGRIYLPRADREAFGVREEDLLARRPTPALGALLGELVFRTRRLFEAVANRLLQRAARAPVSPPRTVEEFFRVGLSPGDLEIMQAVARGGSVYDNLTTLSAKPPAKEVVNARLALLREMGLVELTTDEKNVMHLCLSPTGARLLGEVGSEQHG